MNGAARRWLTGLVCALALPAAPAHADEPIEVATYNLRLHLASDGANAWPHRKEAVKAGAAVVATLNARRHHST